MIRRSMCVACSVEQEADLHEIRAGECSASAAVHRTLAARMGEDTGEGVAALAEAYRGAAKGHKFRAEEIRYDARGGMTEAQARAASEARAEAAGELVDLIHGALAAGVPFPVVQWSRDDAELGGEDWGSTCAERSRLLGVLFTRTVVTDIPPGWVRDYDDGMDWAKARGRRRGLV